MPEQNFKSIDVMIAGAQKAGTSSLGQYLDQHPDIHTHSQLEMAYFVRDEEYEMGFDHVYSKYFQPDIDSKVLLAKSVGIMYFPSAMQRLYEHNPNCKILVILREPVARAYSAYWYMRRVGIEDAVSFSQALDLEGERQTSDTPQGKHCLYRDRGIYHRQIQHLYDLFGPQNVHVLLLNDLMSQPRNTLDNILDFIGIPTLEINTASKSNTAKATRFELLSRALKSNNGLKGAMQKVFPQQYLTSARKFIVRLNERKFDVPKMETHIRHDLAAFFEPHNSELEQLLDRSLESWKVNG